jgi:hypothetical protein
LPAANWNGVSVIPFGLPEENPGSTADGWRTASLLESLRNRYDWVVIDTPAAIDFSDASRLAHHADAVVLIAKAGRSGFDELRKVSIELRRAGGHLAGVVFVDETAFPGRLHFRYRKSKRSITFWTPPGRLVVDPRDHSDRWYLGRDPRNHSRDSRVHRDNKVVCLRSGGKQFV